MLEDEKIVKLPDRLQRLAARAKKAAHAYEEESGAIIASIIEYGSALLEGRAEFTGDLEFGRWVVAEGLNQIKPFTLQEERTAAMKIAELSAQSTVLWADCPHRRPTHIMSWWRARQRPARPARPRPASTPAREDAKEVIRAYKAEHGVYPSVKQAEQVSGYSRIVIEPALAAVIAEDKVAPPQRPSFTKAQNQQVEARIKVRLRELEREFDARVIAENQKQIAILFPNLQKIRDEATRNEKFYREQIAKIAILKVTEYIDILKACHPDNSASKQVRERAFIAINSKKLQLTGTK